ncbi:ABC transporter ATP-binding protein [Sanguibacter sp. HDW7]|uniref:ABC transporter ATP-binding protein n=1 Tax=Sanguibacter sp. HDW7 TaxID=2714931 RepID=UPI001409AFB8|nr:ATP-binding cassette domain-containing protein [Sanguibacter sp. HDW7]QIK84021.1 ATP-binding cassette domain-containing protein [Sanguibacter sp. HDW7]
MTISDSPPGTAARLSVRGLTKRFGTVHAVEDLTFDVTPGRVTGFLGPNGAGKTTTLRMLVGLATPTAGSATIGGRRYSELTDPARTIGVALEASTFHPGRTARAHLRMFAPAAGADAARVEQLLDLVGLTPDADRRVGGYSTGMRQRLALATALLGDPEILVLDEPTNGLDPAGIAWLRSFMRNFAASGRTVLVSSHILSEVQHSVDDVVIVAHGRLVHTSSLTELAARAVRTVTVASPDPAALAAVVAQRGWASEPADATSPGALRLRDVHAAEVGTAAFAAGVELHLLSEDSPGLEDVFLRLTGQTTEVAA